MAETMIDDDAPELTADLLKRTLPAHEVLPETVLAQFKRSPGRPRGEQAKTAVSLRLDADVVEHFRKTGPGWQTRINAALRRAMG